MSVIFLFGFVALFGAPYVPTLRNELKNGFSTLYPLTRSDVVVDLGSGDGRVLAEAVKYGAKGYGYELNPLLAILSAVRLRHKASIQISNMWNVAFPDDTTLVYCFSVSRDVTRLAEKVQHEANRLGRPIHVMTFGSPLPGLAAKKQLNAHSLYKIIPKTAS